MALCPVSAPAVLEHRAAWGQQGCTPLPTHRSSPQNMWGPDVFPPPHSPRGEDKGGCKQIRGARPPPPTISQQPPPGLTRCPQPVLAPSPGEKPVPEVAEEAFEGVGDVVHLVLALLQADAAGVPAQHLQQAGGLRVLPALAIDALRRQPCGRAGGDELVPRHFPPCRCCRDRRGAAGWSQIPAPAGALPRSWKGCSGSETHVASMSGLSLPRHTDGVTQMMRSGPRQHPAISDGTYRTG